MISNYREADAAIFAHKHISKQMQQKYSISQIEYLLDLVFEYCEGLDNKSNSINLLKMTAVINKNIRKKFCEQITCSDLKELLDADNKYMESIGLIEVEDDSDNFIDIDEIIDKVYNLLTENLKKKYKIEDVYEVLCKEDDYLSDLESDDIDETKLYKYIQQQVAAEDMKISITEIKQILAIESQILDEEKTEYI
ncbi:MAG: hypothetical protein LBT27_00970 [Prevotellaceae bacterium]|jgi:hypothetical protein|nr:hypothetical protein [Prevotellaceae bacterium]